MNDMSIVNAFHELGLRKESALIYLALLKSSNSSIRSLSSYTNINRGLVYDCLKELLNVGLINAKALGERNKYCAEDPKYILDMLKDRAKKLESITLKAEQFVPQLSAEIEKPEGKPIVKYFDFETGIVKILKDVLQECSKLPSRQYCAYSSRPLRELLYRKFPDFTDKRISAGIHVDVIAIGEGGSEAKLFHRKWIPEKSGSKPASYTIIYGNKVATIAISNDHTPYGIIIENSGVADMQRLIFEQIWERLD